MFLPSFLLLVFAACYCSAVAVLGERASLTEKASTNAFLLAAGKAPAAPRAMAKYVRSNPTRQHLRAPGRRQGGQASPVPLIFPPHPDTAGYPNILSNLDDSATTINLPFSAQIFGLTGTALRVSSNGYVGFTANEADASRIQDTSRMTAYVAPFSADLIFYQQYAVSAQADATSVTIRWNSQVIYSPNGITDFTLYYTTTQPGKWFIYYDTYTANGDGSVYPGAEAIVDAGQNQSPSQRVIYATGAFRAPNDNLAICFDTVNAVVVKRP